MTEADRIFERFPPFIQEYIFSRGWRELRDVQIAAAKVIFDSEDNLLLSSSTASGKTEAVFFPVLADICDNPPASGVSVLYIAPLKSLINDQFYRLNELLDMSGIPVYHWHGDAGASHKNKVLKDPAGVLQITPESLESMLINRSNDIPRIFAGLRYIIIDEIHSMIGADRGSQVICQICRLQRLLGFSPRRLGLSATIGDLKMASDWLGAGSERKTATPILPKAPLYWKLGIEHFFILDTENASDREINGEDTKKDKNPIIDEGYSFLYDAVSRKKSIVFSNSREETEYVTATLRQIANKRGEDDVFLIHHGNLSASLREDAELKMKDDTVAKAVTCATVTLELGIDIGRLDRVAQVGSPTSVSSFLQRLGRSGRRNASPEMVMLFREEQPLPNETLPHLIPWDLLRAIAIIELYVGERFIEPPRVRKMPLSLAFHQTLSLLAASGELTPAALASRILTLPPLSLMPKEVYRTLLLDMIEKEYLELTPEKGLIIGLKGEKIISSFKFYAVFRDSEDYTVRHESDEIGTITTPPPIGDQFALAGRVWEVIDADLPRRLIYVKHVSGKMEISWPGESGEIHTKILEKMRDILYSDKSYAYLLPNAKKRLASAQKLARGTNMQESLLVRLGGSSWCIFPWLGTRAFRTLKRYLKLHSGEYGLSDIQSEGCYYITFKCRMENPYQLLKEIVSQIKKEGIDAKELVFAGECPIQDKYDDVVPPELLRLAYSEDRLEVEEVLTRLLGEVS